MSREHEPHSQQKPEGADSSHGRDASQKREETEGRIAVYNALQRAWSEAFRNGPRDLGIRGTRSPLLDDDTPDERPVEPIKRERSPSEERYEAIEHLVSAAMAILEDDDRDSGEVDPNYTSRFPFVKLVKVRTPEEVKPFEVFRLHYTTPLPDRLASIINSAVNNYGLKVVPDDTPPESDKK